MQAREAYKGMFPNVFTLLNILLARPVETATVERSFSQMKMVKTRLRNWLSNCNLFSAPEDFHRGTRAK